MSIVKDIIMETVRRMPENVTFEDAARQILDIGSEFERFKTSEQGSIATDELLKSEEEISGDEMQETPERLRILKRIKEAEKAYIEGDVKRISNFEEFWKDIND